MRIALFLLCLLGPPAQASLIDRVVAVVEDQLVVDSEVQLEQELSAMDRDASPFWSAPGDPTERLIDAAVVRVAASDVALYQPSDEEVRARREVLRAAFEDRRAWTDFLDRHGLTEDSLALVLKRRMVVGRYLARNLQVSPEDRGAWKKASDALIAGLRERMRVRTIAAEKSRGLAL